MKKKCIHILGAPLFNASLCEVTIPRIKAYAAGINADVHLIEEPRKFSEYPLTYERFQIFDKGWGYEWNACIDADMVIGTTLPDFTELVRRDSVGIIMSYRASAFFSLDHRFFARTRKNMAPVQSFVVSSDWTHDLWKPLKGTASMHLGAVSNSQQIAEYALAYNIAKYGLQYAGIFPSGSQIFRACGDPQQGQSAVEQAKAKLAEWGQA